MEQKLINQCKSDLDDLQEKEKKLSEFKERLPEFELPTDIERKIDFEVSSEIDIYNTEIEQLTIDLTIDEEEESQCDLEGKYQERVTIED